LLARPYCFQAIPCYEIAALAASDMDLLEVSVGDLVAAARGA
jgi:hypothetical protein